MTDSLPSKKRLYPSDMGSGQYLAAARSWLQSNLPNGDRVTWGSGDLLTMSERQFEDAAAHIAAAAINEDRQKRAHETSASHRGPYCQSKPGDWMDGWGACKVCGGEIPDGHITECAHWKLQVANRRMREALQQWRDACSCGCDACVELIETLSLESAAEHGQEKS